jgi:hypothetical protein
MASDDELGANAKHDARAVAAMARELCSVHFTDGFCEPRDRPDCKCVRLANGCLQSMKSVGVKPVWVFDKSPETLGISTQL